MKSYLRKFQSSLGKWIRTNRTELFVLLFFTVMACIYWYPLPFHLRTAQLEWPPIDTAFNQWIIGWGNHALTHYPWRFFEANMFYPFAHTLAWGDHLFSLAILSLPLMPLFGVLGTYNILLLLTTTLSAYGLYLFVYYLTKNRSVSIVAGLFWVFSSVRIIEAGHIQTLATFWIPFVFLYVEKVYREYSAKHIILFCCFFFLMMATNVYISLFSLLAVATYIFCLFLLKRLSLRLLIIIGLAAGLTSVLAVIVVYLPSILIQLKDPVIRSVYDQHGIFVHELEPWGISSGSSLARFLAKYNIIPYHGEKLRLIDPMLFISLLIGAVVHWRERRQDVRPFIFLLIAILAIIAALGVSIRGYERVLVEKNWLFNLLYEYLPGYKALRFPIRWYFIAGFCLAIFGALGLKPILTKLNRTWQAIIIGALAVWLLATQSPAPIHWHKTYELNDYPSIQWLARQPGEFPILELPIWDSSIGRHAEIMESRRMYLSTYHWKRRVNGAIAPYIPSQYYQNAKLLAKLGEDPAAIALLRQWGVKYIVFTPGDFTLLERDDQLGVVKARLDAMPELQHIESFSDATIYRLVEK